VSRSASRSPRPGVELVALEGGRTTTPVEAFVEAMARELGLGSSASDRRTRRQLFRLTRWATGEGIPLDRERILDPDTVERFVTHALGAERSRSTYRAVLRRVGPMLTKNAPWEPRPEAIARRQLAPPYSDAEVGVLADDANAQPTVARQRAAWAFLLLGLGAGLDGRWATRVTGRDVTYDGTVVRVQVGEPAARSVVVLGALEASLLDLAELSGSECLVGGHSLSNRRTGHLTGRLVTPTGHPRLAPARLRSTWLLWHVRAGTGLPELCEAAGLQGPAVLGDLLVYVEPLPKAVAALMVREAVL
jgi:hypothetical protein